MSETTIPFQGQTAVLDRPPVEPEEGTGQKNRTLLLVLGGVAAALVLGLVAYFLLFSGSQEAAAPAPAAPAPAAPAAPAAPPAEEATDTVPPLSTKSFGRDPFKALITEPAAPTGGTTDPTGGTTDPTGGTTDPTGGTPHTFQEVDVAGNNLSVTVKVDGKTYQDLAAGEVFATYFKVVVINGDNTKFSYGDAVFNPKDNKILTVG